MIAHGQQFGPYRVERLLGRGGMGEVYEAVDETGRRVALKVLTHGIDDPQDRARFLREGRLAASISHPHTVYIYGTDEIEGVPVIAMELATGGSLKDRVRNEGPLAPAQAVDAILEVISGLEAAAAAGTPATGAPAMTIEAPLKAIALPDVQVPLATAPPEPSVTT